VAIPAVIFYNFYANQVEVFEGKMESFSADFLNLVERDLISRI
jgi:biopolymer transport protein TolQ